MNARQKFTRSIFRNRRSALLRRRPAGLPPNNGVNKIIVLVTLSAFSDPVSPLGTDPSANSLISAFQQDLYWVILMFNGLLKFDYCRESYFNESMMLACLKHFKQDGKHSFFVISCCSFQVSPSRSFMLLFNIVPRYFYNYQIKNHISYVFARHPIRFYIKPSYYLLKMFSCPY